jgi:uncharacterized protein
MGEGISWNATTFLDLGFLVLAAMLLWRFLRTGGPEMLRTMQQSGGHGRVQDRARVDGCH